MKTIYIKSSILNRNSKIVNLKSQEGFTLIEIGIAIFILGIGLISMLTIFPIGVDSMKKVTEYSNAAVLTESAISKLIENEIFTDTDIMGTLTANQTYTYTDAYPLNRNDQDSLFRNSFGTTTHAQYSWQANLKSVTGTNNNLVRAQIAIFRNFNSSQFGVGTADFAQQVDKAIVENVSAFPSWRMSNHYIREDSDKFWYRIVGTSTTTITLEGPFIGATGTTLNFSATNDIIDIYETMFSKR